MGRLIAALVILMACAPHMPNRARIETITSAAGGIAEEQSIERLAWLGGCWEARSGRLIVEEYWSAPRGASVLGMSRTLRGDSTVAHELMIVRLGAGRFTMEATPSSQERTVFVMAALTDSSVSFENPAHDFPQRIRYRLTSADSLLAQIEGDVNGRERIVSFLYRRVRCPYG